MRRVQLRRDGIDWIELTDEIVVLNERTEQYLAANASATVLWQLLADGALVSELVGRLAGHYGIPIEAALSDVDELIVQLSACGLVDVIEA